MSYFSHFSIWILCIHLELEYFSNIWKFSCVYMGETSSYPTLTATWEIPKRPWNWWNGYLLLGHRSQLRFIHQYFQKALVSLDSCSSWWVTGNYLYKKEAVGHNVVQPWSHWKMLASFTLRAVESECESWLSSLDSPFSNFHRSHLAFICSPGSLIINQTGAAFRHILRQPACTNRTKLSNLSAWLLTMISFALHNPFLHTLSPKGCCFGRITVQNRRFIAKTPST